MATVNWERLSGEDVEQFVAAALTRKRGSGSRITPSSGDGGIDVLLPKNNNTEWEVVQVKRHSGPLSPKQKANVRASWDRFLEQDLGARKVSAWTLAMPWDPTREALEWLQQFPPETPYAKTWMGRTNLDVLAAENPDLVDYYFGDGAARVERLLTTGLEAGRPTTGLSETSLLEGVLGRTEDLARALDEVDPFYSYEVLVRYGQVPLDVEQFAAEGEGAAMVQFATIDTERYSVMRVIPSHPLAGTLRPIRHRVQFETRAGSADHRKLADFATHGVPFDDLPGNVIEAVGPPGTQRTGLGLFTVRALVNEEFPPLELRAVDLEDAVLAALPLRAPETSSGFSGERFWLRTTDQSGLLTVEARFGGNEEPWQLTLRHGPLIGHPVVEASMVGRLHLSLDRQHTLTVAQVGGPPILPPFSLDSKKSQSGIWNLVDLYARLQQHVTGRVLLPDLERLEQRDINELHNTVRALEGEEVEVQWQPTRLEVPADAARELTDLIDSQQPFESFEVFDHRMPLAGINVDLPGRMAARLLSCRLEVVESAPEASAHLLLTPAANDRALVTAVDDTFQVGRYLGTSRVDQTEWRQ